MKLKYFGIIALGVTLAACKTVPPQQQTAIQQIDQTLQHSVVANNAIGVQQKHHAPASVNAALLPSMSIHLPKSRTPSQRRFNVSVHDVAAKTFFMGLVEGTRYSMVISPKVSGKISLNLKNVTIDQALQAVQDVYGYQYRKTAVGYEILPNELVSEMFTVNYLDVTRKGQSETELSTGQITQRIQNNSTGNGNNNQVVQSSANKRSGSNVETRSNINFWVELQRTLNAMFAGESGRSVIVNAQAGLVIVRAYPAELRQVAKYLDSVQENMNRQVILEAKVLEVQLNNHYQFGIDWRIFGATLNALADTQPFPGSVLSAVDNSTFPDAFQAVIKWNTDFSTTIRALETQGNVQVLSSPRVSTMNNQKAVIKVGQDEFFVTGVSSSNSDTNSGNVIPTQDIELTPFFSGITLDVTPQISANRAVTLHIHPAVSVVKDQRKEITLGTGVDGARQNFNLPLALSTIRESDTVVHALDGQVVVIGGLMSNQTTEDVAGVPFFANLPFLGTLFKNTKHESVKNELVILLRPVVVKNFTWTRQLIDSKDKYQKLNRGFHIGGRPDIYGSEGEKVIHYGGPLERRLPQQQQGNANDAKNVHNRVRS